MNEFNELDEMYREIILDHYRSPRNNQPILKPTKEIESNNPFCGDEIKIQISLDQNQKTIVSVSGRGCAISQASGSLMAEKIDLLPYKELQSNVDLFRKLIRDEILSEEELDSLGDVSALSGVRKFPVRIKCAMLSWVALEEIIKKNN